jgi:hypothetical protein
LDGSFQVRKFGKSAGIDASHGPCRDRHLRHQVLIPRLHRAVCNFVGKRFTNSYYGAGPAYRISFAPETTSAKRNERLEIPLKVQENQRQQLLICRS